MLVPELLAPAGSLDAVRAAIANGANSVYLGVERFNARDEGAQLTLEELDQACAMARARGVSWDGPSATSLSIATCRSTC